MTGGGLAAKWNCCIPLWTVTVCRVAFNTLDGAPYIVPLNFGYEISESGILTIYFHGANEGRKLDLLNHDARVGFELDCAHELQSADLACKYTFRFESIIGSGNIAVLSDATERIHGLNVLMSHYGGDGKMFDESALAVTTVLRLDVAEYCGKRL
jgi:nitroimidazol reductase NimA-like FMN-containing flavoprotein (pyridoxamine 5'-phosphate oxidase superfamily)